jgi:hypothetical protein
MKERKEGKRNERKEVAHEVVSMASRDVLLHQICHLLPLAYIRR